MYVVPLGIDIPVRKVLLLEVGVACLDHEPGDGCKV